MNVKKRRPMVNSAKDSLDSSSSERETPQDTPVSSRTRARQAQEEPVKLRKNVRWDKSGPFPVVDQNVTLSVLAKTIGDLQEDLAEAQAKAAALATELAEEKAKAAALTSRLQEEHINWLRLEVEKENFKEAMKASMPDPARMEDALNDYFDERNWEHDGDAATDEELDSDMMDI